MILFRSKSTSAGKKYLLILFVFSCSVTLGIITSKAGLPQKIIRDSYAQATDCTATDISSANATGLISATDGISGFKSSIGTCINSSQTQYIYRRIRDYSNYDSIFSVFYTQSRASKQQLTAGFPTDFGNTSKLYSIRGNLTIEAPGVNSSVTPAGDAYAVIFVEGNLDIKSNLVYHTDNNGIVDGKGGIVFVTKGHINIYPQVRQIDAVLISYGTICTYFETDPCSSTLTPELPLSSKLKINGNITSLNPNLPARFRRNLINNREAAELVNNQAKYLVGLKGLMSQTLIITSEE